MKIISRTWEAPTRAGVVSKSVVFFLIVVFVCVSSCDFLNKWQTQIFPTNRMAKKILCFSLTIWVSCWMCSHFNIRISAFRCFFFVFHEKKRHLHFVWDMGSWAMCCPKSHGSLWGPEQKAELGHSLHLLPQREREREGEGRYRQNRWTRDKTNRKRESLNIAQPTAVTTPLFDHSLTARSLHLSLAATALCHPVTCSDHMHLLQTLMKSTVLQNRQIWAF